MRGHFSKFNCNLRIVRNITNKNSFSNVFYWKRRRNTSLSNFSSIRFEKIDNSLFASRIKKKKRTRRLFGRSVALKLNLKQGIFQGQLIVCQFAFATIWQHDCIVRTYIKLTAIKQIQQEIEITYATAFKTH